MITTPPDVTDDHSGPTLIVTRGLPGSGKTTWALKQLAERPHGTAARVNRDDLRRMTHGKPRYDKESERVITAIQRDAIRTLLRLGHAVVNDDTNLDDGRMIALMVLADETGAHFKIEDFTHVSLETCIRRDWHRKGTDAYVGEDVIRDMHRRHLAPVGDDQ